MLNFIQSLPVFGLHYQHRPRSEVVPLSPKQPNIQGGSFTMIIDLLPPRPIEIAKSSDSRSTSTYVSFTNLSDEFSSSDSENESEDEYIFDESPYSPSYS